MRSRNRHLKHAKNLILITLFILAIVTFGSCMYLEQNMRNVLLEFVSFNYVVVFGTVNILPKVFGY